MIDNIDSIPNSWSVVKVYQVGELLRGINYNKLESSSNQQEHYRPILRSNNIQETLIFDDLVYVDEKNFSSFHSLRKGDILFAMSSGSKHLVGKTAKVTLDCNYGWGAFCSILRPFEIVDKNLIAYFFKAPAYKKLVSEISKGTNINNLKREHILDLIFPLPPLTEQQRIVAKIEELFSELDKGIETLKTAQQQLKVYRQAVLKYAFEGKLTNPNVKEGELPVGWNYKILKDLTTKIVDGTHHTPTYVKDGVHFISVKDINDYKIDFTKTKFISKEEHDILKNRCNPEEGDILITKSGTIGRLSIVPSKPEFSLFVSVALLKIRKDLLKSKFALYSIQNHVNHLNIEKDIKGGLLKNYHLEDLRKATIMCVPIEEQDQVIQEIESRLSVCDKIEESI